MKSVLLFFLTTFCISSISGQYHVKPDIDLNYCHLLGYKTVKESNNTYVLLPNGNKVSSLKFLRGEVGKEYSYCAKKGYDLRIKQVNDGGSISRYPVCVKNDKNKEIEISLIRFIYDEGDYGVLFPDNPSPEKPPISSMRRPSPPTFIPPNPNLDLFCDYRDSVYFRDTIFDQICNGACYAYSFCAVGEYAITKALDLSTSIDLSEECLIYCFDDCTDGILGGCDGIDTIANNYYPFYVACEDGILEETSISGTCTDEWNNNTRFVFNNYYNLSTNYHNIQQEINDYGPVHADITLDGYDWGIYTSLNDSTERTIFNKPRECNGKDLVYYHGVAIIGWGTHWQHGLYWIIKNSESDDWGDDGYGYIKANSSKVSCTTRRIEYIEREIAYHFTQQYYGIPDAPASADNIWWNANDDSISNVPITTDTFVPTLVDTTYNGFHTIKGVVKYNATDCTPAYDEDTLTASVWVGKPTPPTIYGPEEIFDQNETYYASVPLHQHVFDYDWDVISGGIEIVSGETQPTCVMHPTYPGPAVLRITIENYWGTAYKDKTIYVGAPAPLVFPNPTSGLLNIHPNYPYIDLDDIEFSLTNSIDEKKKWVTSKGENVTIDVSDLPNGIYYLRTIYKRIEKGPIYNTQQIVISK